MDSFRVVLDANVFSLDHFDVLDRSPIRDLVSRGRLELIYGDVMLNEVIASYGVTRTRDAFLTRWVPFILGTATKFGADLQTIWQREVIQGRGPHASIWLPAKAFERIKAELSSLPSDGTWPGLDETKGERDDEAKKKANQRALSVDIRQVASRALRARNITADKVTHEAFRSLTDQHMETIGRAVGEAHFHTFDARAVANRWARAKGRYPYFTQFAANMTYKELYAMFKPNAPIDTNAQADLDILTHLLRADAVVTNEIGFMRTAFNDLWRSRGKTLFTSEEFAEFLRPTQRNT